MRFVQRSCENDKLQIRLLVALRHMKRRELNLMTTTNLRLHLHVLAAFPAVFTHFKIHVNYSVAAD